MQKKKAVYYEGLETGKLEMSLVGERLKQLGKEEEDLARRLVDAEQRLNCPCRNNTS